VVEDPDVHGFSLLLSFKKLIFHRIRGAAYSFFFASVDFLRRSKTVRTATSKSGSHKTSGRLEEGDSCARDFAFGCGGTGKKVKRRFKRRNMPLPLMSVKDKTVFCKDWEAETLPPYCY
jgi:hypothetical protein